MEIAVPSLRQSSLLSLAAAVVFGSLAADGRAADLLAPESSGLRFGVASSGTSINFHQGEAFADWNLPWKWNLGAQWTVQTRLDVSAGWFGEGDVGAGIFSAGPRLVLAREHLPVSLEGGVSATGITRTEFEGKNFGEPFQFTTSIGVSWDFASHFRLGSAFQHMSNAGMSRHNPGINMIMFSLGYVF
jgi:hypothetical protein